MLIRLLAMLFFLTCLNSCTGLSPDQEKIKTFVSRMSAQPGFDRTTLTNWIDQVNYQEEIITKITKPAEHMPWHKYRKIFLTEQRIKDGVTFWQRHADTLLKVSNQFGVPAEIIVAIIGVETFYGQHTGKYRAIDALATLAFAYPPRSNFFETELANLLWLAKEESIDPFSLSGSYAGALGIPQFIPSSFRRYSIDFNGDNKRDIWHNFDDAIASVGHYLVRHGWQKNQPIALPVEANDLSYKAILNDNLKPNLRISELESLRLKIKTPLLLTAKVKIMAFENINGEELWAGLDNFYVITQYNRSPLYALAVFELSQAISKFYRVYSYEVPDPHNSSYCLRFSWLYDDSSHCRI